MRSGGGGSVVTNAVRQLVASEITIAAKDFLALVAFIRLVVGVGQKVGLEVGALVEAPVADRTFVGRFLHVEDLMDS